MRQRKKENEKRRRVEFRSLVAGEVSAKQPERKEPRLDVSSTRAQLNDVFHTFISLLLSDKIKMSEKKIYSRDLNKFKKNYHTSGIFKKAFEQIISLFASWIS